MKLTPEQTASVKKWASEGASLSQIQDNLREIDVHLTYMEARLLMMDIEVELAENKPEPEPEPELDSEPAATAPDGGGPEEMPEDDDYPLPEEDFGDGTPNVRLEPDTIVVPGALASGKVTFSDGKEAKWYVDSAGRLGLVPPEKGYQPPAADGPEFQRQLGQQLRRMGLY